MQREQPSRLERAGGGGGLRGQTLIATKSTEGPGVITSWQRAYQESKDNLLRGQSDTELGRGGGGGLGWEGLLVE